MRVELNGKKEKKKGWRDRRAQSARRMGGRENGGVDGEWGTPDSLRKEHEDP